MNTTSLTKMHHEMVAVTERAESAEAELLAVREDNHSMMLEIDGLRTERDRLAAELQKMREQKPVAWMHDKGGRVDTCHDSVKELWIKVGQKQNTQFMREIVPCRVEHYNIPLYAAPVPAPAVPDGDDFNGTTPHMIQCMEALVRLDADGVLVPHGIGRDASKLLSAAANRLQQQAASSVPEEWRKALQEAHDTFQRYADLHRAKDTSDGHEKANANQRLANKLYALLQSADGHSSQAQNEV